MPFFSPRISEKTFYISEMEEGNFYHIYNRGNNKQPIFFEKKNYYHFLNRFDKYLSSFLDIYAYCLMPNHFHFLAKIRELAQTTVVLKTTVVFSWGLRLRTLD